VTQLQTINANLAILHAALGLGIFAGLAIIRYGVPRLPYGMWVVEDAVLMFGGMYFCLKGYHIAFTDPNAPWPNTAYQLWSILAVSGIVGQSFIGLVYPERRRRPTSTPEQGD